MHQLTNLDAEDAANACGLGGAALVVRRIGGPSRRGDEARLRPHLRLPAASMIKVPIAAALGDRFERGAANPDDRIVVSAANVTPNDADSPLVPGYDARLGELAALMIARSDNVATNELIDTIGRRRITAYARSLGLHATAVRRKLSGSLPLVDDPEAEGRNSHSAHDAAMLFEMIAKGTIARAAWLRELLAAQEFNTKLSAGLRPGDRFLHKTGDTSEVSHDGGILELQSGTRYIVVAYTALPSSPETDRRFACFMRALRSQLT